MAKHCQQPNLESRRNKERKKNIGPNFPPANHPKMMPCRGRRQRCWWYTPTNFFPARTNWCAICKAMYAGLKANTWQWNVGAWSELKVPSSQYPSYTDFYVLLHVIQDPEGQHLKVKFWEKNNRSDGKREPPGERTKKNHPFREYHYRSK